MCIAVWRYVYKLPRWQSPKLSWPNDLPRIIFGSSLGHNLKFCPNVLLVSRICIKRNHSTDLLMWSSLQTKEGQRRSEFHLVGLENIIKLLLQRRQYDPTIIERTVCVVLGPYTALYRPFLKHWTRTNKGVWITWRALSKPPQRRQGPDPYKLRVAQPTLTDFTRSFWYTTSI